MFLVQLFIDSTFEQIVACSAMLPTGNAHLVVAVPEAVSTHAFKSVVSDA